MKSPCQLSRFVPYLQRSFKINCRSAWPGDQVWFCQLHESEAMISSHKPAGFANVSGLQTMHQAMPKDADLVGLGDLEHLFSLEPAE